VALPTIPRGRRSIDQADRHDEEFDILQFEAGIDVMRRLAAEGG